MKITKVEYIPLVYKMTVPFYSGVGKATQRQLLIIKIHTDNGLIGLGEAATFGGPIESTAVVLEKEIAPLLIGEDPMNVERIWHKCYFSSFQHGRAGIFICALSGVDLALWDIIGKFTKQPVYKLLGGFRKSVTAYASAGFYMQGKTVKDLVSEVCRYADMGFPAVKIKVGRTDTPLSLGILSSSRTECMVTFEEDLERVEVSREALGSGMKLMVDANAAWSYNDAVRAGRFFDSLKIYFFEEPVRTDDYEGSALLARELDTRIAGYETECLAVNYARMISMGAVDIVQPDLCWAGGITESRKIAVLAAAHNRECAAHVFSSGILLAASLHFTCGIPNGAMLEYDMSDNIFRHELVKEPILPDKNGVITVSDAPGFGVELNEDMVEKYRVDSR